MQEPIETAVADPVGSAPPQGNHRRPTAERAAASHERDDTQQIFEEFCRTRDPELRARLVERHTRLVRHIAYKFANRGEPVEDLIQVGSLALVKAIDRYNPSVGAAFTTYATPTIIGEIKRYFRDLAWTMRVPRSLQELRLQVNRTSEQLSQTLGRIPTVREIAAALNVSQEQVLEAEEMGSGHGLTSLDIEVDNGDDARMSRLLDFMGESEGGYGHVENRLQLQRAIGALNPQQRAVIYLRYYAGLSQSACARQLGVSQMQVSRLQSQVLKRLRALLQEHIA